MVRIVARSYHLGVIRWILVSISAVYGLYGCTSTAEPSGIPGAAGYGGAIEGAASTQGPVTGNGGTTTAAGSGSVVAGTGVVGGRGPTGAGGKNAGGAGGKSTGGKGGQAGTASTTQCASLPKLPITKYTKLAVSGSEDFTFDNLGYLIGVDSATNELIRTKYDGTEEIVFPNIGTSAQGGFPVRGLRFVAGANSNTGELIFADVYASGLTKVDMGTRVRTSLVSGVNQPNGLALDPNGIAYLTGADGNVIRVDTKTGKSSVFFAQVEANVSLDGIAFSPDYKRLYINTEFGYLSYLPVKDDGTAGDYVLMAQFSQELPDGGTQGMPSALDGMTVDECGNIYVVNMSGIIWRVAPDSLMETPKIEKVVTIQIEVPDAGTNGGRPMGPPGGMLNAVNFGTGVGGWKANAIYLISMMGGVYEVVVGVKGAKQPHL